MMRLFKNCLWAATLVVVTATTAGAASFTMKRGLNLDIWMTWPEEDRWNQRDVMLPFPEWRQKLKRKDLVGLKKAGFDFLRMPVDPSPFLSDQTAEFRDELVASVVESARTINSAGMKVVVDMHLIAGGSGRAIGMGEVMDDPAMFERYLELVRTMGQALARQDPQQVAFEPMNEPVIDCDDETSNLWAEKLQRLYAAARASAARLTIVLSGSCYSSSGGLARVDPRAIADDNIIWTFHSYDPFLLTHQGATWAGDFIRYVTGIPYPPYKVSRAELDAALETIRQHIRDEAPAGRRQGMLEYLDEQIALMDTPAKLDAIVDEPFERAAKWARENGIAPENIHLGEFGMIRQEYDNPYVVPPAERAAYVKDMIEHAEKHGFPWSVWEYGGAFGIVEEFDGRPAEPGVLDMIRDLPAPPADRQE